MIRYLWVGVCANFVVGCGPTVDQDGNGNGSDASVANDQVRAACPTLSEEVLDAFIVSIERLQEESLPEKEEAMSTWVEGCQAIPPDGNFGGDEQSCATCMIALVDEVYD